MTPASHQKYIRSSYSLSLCVLQLFQWILLNHSSQNSHLRFVNILQILVFPNKIVNLIKFNHQYERNSLKKHTQIKQYWNSQTKTCKSLFTRLQIHCIRDTHIRVWLIYFLIITVRLSVCSATCFPHPHPLTPVKSFFNWFSSQYTWSSGFLNQGWYHSTPGNVFIFIFSSNAS